MTKRCETSARSLYGRRTVLAGLVLIMVMAPLAACGKPAVAPTPVPQHTSPDITGIVWQVSDAGGGTGALLVVGLQGAPGSYDRASVRLTKGTTWQTGHGSAMAPPPLDRELIGRRVAVTFTGAVAESYPVQAAAAAVTLFDPLGVSMHITLAGEPQLRGKVVEVGRDGQGRISSLTVLPDEALTVGASGTSDSTGGTPDAVPPNGDVVQTTVKVTKHTAWLLDTPTELKSCTAPLIGNGLDPKVDVRVENGVAAWVVVHLRDVYVGQ